ncbi:MAG: DNA-binding response regulator, partial [Deltaproteobacteria bacterium]|nr:DNA-binding response regulator [Deltaproteobacteria bacterium]
MADRTRVLVAEDDKATHEDWSESLGAWGYEVAVAEDGDRAIELIR